MDSPSSTQKDFDLRTICDALGDITTKWFKVGIQLGIPRNKLLEFKKEDDPLSAVVDYWLRGNVTESVVPISWKSIVAALNSKYVGEPGLAEEINMKYCQHQDVIKAEEVKPKPARRESSDKPKYQMDPNVKMDLEFILERNIEEIIEKYAAYVNCILAIIKEKGVSPEDLRSYLLTLSASSNSYKGQKLALLSEKKSELKEKDTINEIFDLLSTECASFMNYSIFPAIMKKFNIAEDRDELKYCDYLQTFCKKHKICEFKKVNPLLKEKEGLKQLVLKYDIESTCRLAKVDDLKKFIAKILNLNPSTLHIVDIEEGCIVVTFLIPASVADAIFTPYKVFTLQEEDELRAASVLWLQCNGCLFNFEKKKSSAFRKLKEQLTCSICLGTYIDPKILHCYHVFCQLCLTRLVQQHQQGQVTVTCPTCRHVTPIPASGMAGLQADFRANQLLDLLDNDGEESAATARLPVDSSEISTSASNLMPLPSSTVLYCSEHDKREICLYCETCDKPVCLKCVMKGSRHQSHVCEELEEYFEKMKAEVSLSLAAIEAVFTLFRERRDELSDQQAAIEAEISNTILPDVRKTELISQLQQLTHAKVKSLAAERDQIETIQVQLSRHLDSMRESTPSSEGELLKTKTTTITQVKKLTTSLQPDALKPSTEANIVLSDLVDLTTECLKYGLVSSCPPDPSKCYNSTAGKGDLTVVEIGKKITGILQMVDTHNQPCSVPLKSITCELVSDDVVQKGSVERRGGSQYDISCRPTTKGRHQLHIKVEGQHISKSPFVVSVIEFQIIGGVIKPMGAALLKWGEEVLVTEAGRNRVLRINPSEEKDRSIGSFSSGSFGYLNPYAVAVDYERNILVADSVEHCIQKLTRLGDMITLRGFNGDGSSNCYPTGIAFNFRNCLVYVVSGNSVWILNPDFSTYSSFGGRGEGEGQFNNPQHIACDITGRIYVADWGNHRIQVFTAEGKFLWAFTSGAEKWYPFGVAVDSSGKVYVSETWNHQLSVFTTEGQFVTSLGSMGSAPGQFRHPRGVTIGRNDMCYVCDQDNNRVQVFHAV